MPRQRSLSKAALESLGANIRAAREAARFATATDGAEEAGVTLSLLSQWENGQMEPTLDSLLRLAIAFQCPLDDFFGGVSDAYDQIIDRRIPINERQQLKARVAAIKRLVQDSLDRAEVAIASAPIATANAVGPETTSNKSPSARALRAKPKKKP